MNFSEIPIIDTHSHFSTGKPVDPQRSESHKDTEEFLDRMRIAANIEKTFMSTYASVIDPSYIVSENEYLRRLCLEKDYLYQWVVVDPRIDESIAQAREILKTDKCVGIKLHPVFHKYSVLEYGDKIFPLAAEFETRVLIHPEGKSGYILPIADKYSNVNIIMAHLNGKDDDQIDAVARAKHGNVYTDIATIGSASNNAIENAVEKIGSERILFGTDTYAAGYIRGRVEYAPISDEDKLNILIRNTQRLFKDKL
ncbi:MAG: amidohydrolase [Ruminococcaceae bacterium]|nr:amidohydrolase [Oscillospiraceae bacterium]